MLPEVLQVLHPLKETDSHAATIGVDVRQNRDASVTQDLVTLQPDRTIKKSLCW